MYANIDKNNSACEGEYDVVNPVIAVAELVVDDNDTQPSLPPSSFIDYGYYNNNSQRNNTSINVTNSPSLYYASQQRQQLV